MKKAVALVVLVMCGVCTVYSQTGLLKEISGIVEIKKPGTHDFIPAKAGDTLTRDTVVSTGFKSTALIAVGSSSIVVRPLTSLSLAELSMDAGTETINVNLQTGRVRVDVSPPAGTRTNMTVRGPAASASVRGTGFDFDTRNLKVRHGKVAFQGNKGGVMIVGAGASSTVGGTGKAADPIDATTGALVPPPPPGTGSVPTHRPLPSLADFTLNLDYGNKEDSTGG
jgi:hypothetical protein